MVIKQRSPALTASGLLITHSTYCILLGSHLLGIFDKTDIDMLDTATV